MSTTTNIGRTNYGRVEYFPSFSKNLLLKPIVAYNLLNFKKFNRSIRYCSLKIRQSLNLEFNLIFFKIAT